MAVLANAINAFPNLYSNRLLLIGQAMAPSAEAAGSAPFPAAAGPDPSRSPTPGQLAGDADGTDPAASAPLCLAQAAAAAYYGLLLRNKLKLQGMLGPLGSALAASPGPVAAVVSHALRQLLGSAPPKERARLCMALFHQTPLGCRCRLAQVGPACMP